MSTAPQTAETRTHYLNADYGIRSWLLTTDHKRIALLYLVTVTLFFAVGGFLAVLIRLELLTPAGDLVSSDAYNRIFTMHGITMISQDVIHSFYVPAFRVKQDVLPGKRYTTVWFQATKPGSYHLFCAEYCGTKHSGMIGQVVVMEPAQYQIWLSGGAGEGSLAANGQKLFRDLACDTCHRADTGARGPDLAGLFGRPVTLSAGNKVVADESYIRESIVNPTAKVTFGYQPIMPTFQGQISEEGLLQLVAYIKSLEASKTAAPAPGAAPPVAAVPETRKQSK